MKTSTETAKIDAVLSKAQGEFDNPERNREVKVRTKDGGSYSFVYATFDAIIAMARPILAKHGINVVQGVSTSRDTDHLVTVTTRVSHAGEFYETEVSARCGTSPQEIGSTITYLKRYSYCSMLGIAAEEDDDGNAGSGHEATATPRKQLPACPACGKQTSVIVGKPEFGGGLVCFSKKEGCGHTWATPEHPARNKDGTPLDPEPPKTKSNGKKADAPSTTFTKAYNALCEYRAANDVPGLKKWREGVVKNHKAGNLTSEEVVKLATEHYTPRCDTLALCETAKAWALELFEVVGDGFKERLDQMWNLANAKQTTLKEPEPEEVGA